MALRFFFVFSLALFLAGITGVGPAFAGLRVSPMTLDLLPVGTGATRTVRVENAGEYPIKVEMSVVRRMIAEDGAVTLVDAEDDFLIFPPVTQLQPLGAQTIRAQWLGDPEISKTQSYYLFVQEVPGEIPKGKSGIAIALRFGIALHVSPRGAEEEVVVRDARYAQGPKGQPGVEVVAENLGTKYAHLGKYEMDLRYQATSGEAVSYTANGHEIRQAINSVILLPGNLRRFFFPLSQAPQPFSGFKLSLKPE